MPERFICSASLVLLTGALDFDTALAVAMAAGAGGILAGATVAIGAFAIFADAFSGTFTHHYASKTSSLILTMGRDQKVHFTLLSHRIRERIFLWLDHGHGSFADMRTLRLLRIRSNSRFVGRVY